MDKATQSSKKDIICRNGEELKSFYRSKRFFLANGQWFFDTREQASVGPFGTEGAANRALNLYLQEIKSENASIAVALSRANNGHWSITNYQ